LFGINDFENLEFVAAGDKGYQELIVRLVHLLFSYGLIYAFGRKKLLP